jgi:hypothetical protein
VHDGLLIVGDVDNPQKLSLLSWARRLVVDVREINEDGSRRAGWRCGKGWELTPLGAWGGCGTGCGGRLRSGAYPSKSGEWLQSPVRTTGPAASCQIIDNPIVPSLFCSLQNRLKPRVAHGIGVACFHEVGVVRVAIGTESGSRLEIGRRSFSGDKPMVAHLVACQSPASSATRYEDIQS